MNTNAYALSRNPITRDCQDEIKLFVNTIFRQKNKETKTTTSQIAALSTIQGDLKGPWCQTFQSANQSVRQLIKGLVGVFRKGRAQRYLS